MVRADLSSLRLDTDRHHWRSNLCSACLVHHVIPRICEARDFREVLFRRIVKTLGKGGYRCDRWDLCECPPRHDEQRSLGLCGSGGTDPELYRFEMLRVRLLVLCFSE